MNDEIATNLSPEVIIHKLADDLPLACGVLSHALLLESLPSRFGDNREDILDWIICARELKYCIEASKDKNLIHTICPNFIFEKLAKSSTQSVCGKPFKDGDFSYHCKTCAFDPTCVFCQSCFKKSNHIGHEVYMYRTTAGGCCDCGDVEAWAVDGFCCDHSGVTSSASTR